MSDALSGTCGMCGLDLFYDPELHRCRTEPRQLAGSWLDEIKQKQGIDKWKEER